MSDAEPNSQGESRHPSEAETAPGKDAADGAGMRARSWTIAARFRAPEDYDIPPLPDWVATRTDENGLALATSEAAEPFISADDPMRVRR
ncbi:hypothetical protein [Haloarchaeobius amylolyticus]|uniref:hypothetical protein n=1 Tax=Haloarchaeobius amylolyticus TaxID=1198296 RepID=UPI00226E93E7|nr:hypothetical protein [Haloarchaeobius amylolyticus]